jgi:hypothetical protein
MTRTLLVSQLRQRLPQLRPIPESALTSQPDSAILDAFVFCQCYGLSDRIGEILVVKKR